MKLFIRYMVSIRCKMVVKAALDELGLTYTSVELGEVQLKENISVKNREMVKVALLKAGLDLLDDNKAILIERIKGVIVEMIYYADEIPKTNYSDYISDKLKLNYTYLSNVFCEVTGTTIEHFIIAHKIEKVKELIIYDEINLSEIAFKMHYSSVAHLSSQFKKVTGLTPSFFKSLRRKRRKNFENL